MLGWCGTRCLGALFAVAAVGYVPEVHEQAMAAAFDEAYAEPTTAYLHNLTARSPRVPNRMTKGTCKANSLFALVHVQPCKDERGPTDCLDGKCVCKYGYAASAKDGGETCEKALKCDGEQCYEPTRLTSGTCSFFGCHSWRGPTYCDGGKCKCQSGYFASADYTKCVTVAEYAKTVTEQMMAIGIREDDEYACPHSFQEMSKQGVERLVKGRIKYSMSSCRKSIQAYHASPLPLVYETQLTDPPNLSSSSTNDDHLYSLQTNRQWRTSVVQLMARLFTYALVTPDLAEAARRLGNLQHTLTDAWSASHVERHVPKQDKPLVVPRGTLKPFGNVGCVGNGKCEPNEARCKEFTIKTPLSMDVIEWGRHVVADKSSDMLWECAKLWTSKSIDLWAKFRIQHQVGWSKAMGLDEVNSAIDEITNEVFCPSLPFKSDDLSKPSGGARKHWSTEASVFGGKAVLPMGTASEADAKRIINEWEHEIAQASKAAIDNHDQDRFGQGIFYPARGLDACSDPTSAHIDQTFLEAVTEQPDVYIVPSPDFLESEKVCGRFTGGTCEVFRCRKWRRSKCEDGKCVCGETECDVGGVCRPRIGYQGANTADLSENEVADSVDTAFLNIVALLLVGMSISVTIMRCRGPQSPPVMAEPLLQLARPG